MSSNSGNPTTALAENKVLILYILNLIESDIKQDDLFKIITSINNINYFYFKQILTDLIDSKLVGIYTKEEEQVVKITSERTKRLYSYKRCFARYYEIKSR